MVHGVNGLFNISGEYIAANIMSLVTSKMLDMRRVDSPIKRPFTYMQFDRVK